MNSAIPCCSTVNRHFIGANLRWVEQFASPFLGWPAGTEASRKAGWNIAALAQGGARRHRDQWQDSAGGRRGTPRRSVDVRSLGRSVVPAGRDSEFWPPTGLTRLCVRHRRALHGLEEERAASSSSAASFPGAGVARRFKRPPVPGWRLRAKCGRRRLTS